jgi:hypothetical protein
MTVYRERHHKSGQWAGQVERYLPDADARGLYELADPNLGEEKHHKKNAIFASSESVALHLVRKYGFSLRMRGYFTGQRNLISATEIKGL